MPYLQVELDARPKAALVANAVGVHPGLIMWGLEEMWAYVLREKRDHLPGLMLAGFFGTDERIPALLVAHNFLEPLADGMYRVRGSWRILRAQAGRSKGGHAAKGNLIPGARYSRLGVSAASAGSAQPLGSSREGPSAAVSAALGSSPSTKHQAPVEDLAGRRSPPAQEDAFAEVKGKKPDPRHAPLVKALTDAYMRVTGAKYAFTGADAKAVERLLARGSDEEILRRWESALTRSYGAVRELKAFESRFNEFVAQAGGRVELSQVDTAAHEAGGEAVIR